MVDFGRLLTAMVTPFNDELEIDYDQVDKLVDHLIETGTDTIVVAGTTGESPTLSGAEKVALFKRVAERAAGRAKVIAGTGSNNTKASIELSQQAEAAGVDGLMLVAPYYNKPSQEGLYQHFKTIAKSTALPVMIYNIPGRSAINIEVETILRLAEVDNITSVKEASGDLSAVSELVEKSPAGFKVYSGDDKLALPTLSVGGYGVVSVSSHVVGNQLKEMIEAYVAGQVEKAATLHRKYMPVFEGLFITANPVPVKYALEKQGVSVGSVRLPLVSVTEEEAKFIDSLFT
ncbi:4-hydroxy-tetrahydrodipicolinate synthase [Ammoniphilus oxalaticus]|uniref:4-hydroxy-tetrahydrodipicolinate synthase n=1 Tax=Ammoniphilus oxalaticus TaxID=66863 RepID=A0A419SK24_9BACL|nr:4-hydroxy-tetrahydrodipicolinate synthase [Ammoniphilus oxalaticus]RKD24286.1 4-hydroxy-tetrahydrodipicolinate synthase [Ammoniphilus oxalaticus]